MAVGSPPMKPATNTLAELFHAPVRYVVPLYQREQLSNVVDDVA
jgi:hypothetical protein